jgi:hypothetical protein
VAQDIPQAIVLKRHRDLEGRSRGIWIRRGFLVLFGAIPAVALANVFGQRPSPVTASVPAASLQLYAPAHVRGGLLWEARFTIDAHRELKKAVLELGHVPAGQKYMLFMQFQVNPTNVGRRPQTVRLYDDKQLLLTMHRKVTVFP